MAQNVEQIEARLCAYVDGELDATERAEIEKYLVANPGHRQLLSELRQTRGLLAALPRHEAPTDLADALQGQLERSILLGPDAQPDSDAMLKISRWPQFMSAAAIVLLAIGLGAVVYFVLPSQNASTVALHQPAGSGVVADSAAPNGRLGKGVDLSFNPPLDDGRAEAKDKLLTPAAEPAPAPASVVVPTSPERAKMRPFDPGEGLLEWLGLKPLEELAARPRPLNNPIVLTVASNDLRSVNEQVVAYLKANRIAFSQPGEKEWDAMVLVNDDKSSRTREVAMNEALIGGESENRSRDDFEKSTARLDRDASVESQAAPEEAGKGLEPPKQESHRPAPSASAMPAMRESSTATTTASSVQAGGGHRHDARKADADAMPRPARRQVIVARGVPAEQVEELARTFGRLGEAQRKRSESGVGVLEANQPAQDQGTLADTSVSSARPRATPATPGESADKPTGFGISTDGTGKVQPPAAGPGDRGRDASKDPHREIVSTTRPSTQPAAAIPATHPAEVIAGRAVRDQSAFGEPVTAPVEVRDVIIFFGEVDSAATAPAADQ